MQHKPSTCFIRAMCAILLLTVMSFASACLPLFPFGECWPPANPNARVVLRGEVWSGETQEPLMGASVDASLFTDGEQTTRSNGLIVDPQNPIAPLTGEDGAFGVSLRAIGPPCVTPPDLPPPDLLKVVVEFDGCTHEFSFGITEENFVDPEFNDGVLELKNPILVPACEE